MTLSLRIRALQQNRATDCSFTSNYQELNEPQLWPNTAGVMRQTQGSTAPTQRNTSQRGIDTLNFGSAPSYVEPLLKCAPAERRWSYNLKSSAVTIADWRQPPAIASLLHVTFHHQCPCHPLRMMIMRCTW